VTYLRARLWPAIAIAIVVLGAVGSFFAGHVVARSDAQASHLRFVTTSQEIASTLQLALQHEEDLVVSAGTFFVEGPAPSQERFRQWIAASLAFARYPELSGIAEVVVVPASRLATFERRSLSDPAGALSGGAFQVIPAGHRPYYCFASVALSRTGLSTSPAGFDYCDSLLGSDFLRARDTGKGTYLPYGSGSSEQLVLGTPTYRTGTVPTTLAARRAAFIGWIGTNVQPGVILATALKGHRDMEVAFEYRGTTPAVTFTDGTAPSGASTTSVNLNNGWIVRTYAGLTGDGIFSNANALTVGLGGLLLSLLLGALILVLGTGRSRALVMVHERTDQLRHLVLHDSLTGLPNRALILDRIERMMAHARRDRFDVAVLFLDLDNFKDVNDTLGHDAGDQLLVAVGARLTNALRNADTVGRLGGDEFVILVEGDSLALGAQAVAERILDVLTPPFDITASDQPLVVSASVGVAEGLRDQPEELLRDADVAMYRAKSVGKHCAVVFAPEMQKLADDQRRLAADLATSLQGDQYFLLYQPTINLATGDSTGVEALLRWRHPVRGVIAPDDFIPALESSGLIVEVGAWVLHEACRQGAQWRDAGHHFAVSVNVSVRQLHDDRFVAHVAAALDDNDFDPPHLILELTETTLTHDVPTTVARLAALKDLGVRLAIDDFGTGYSSLAYLRQFPIDILKIDRSFVSGIIDTQEAVALVHTLVQFGKTLGLETVAEGVENDEQRRQLVAEHVDTGQGFLFARPMSAQAVTQFLESPTSR
jgi:diguanylate cyclase (GGDEF)-like protein